MKSDKKPYKKTGGHRTKREGDGDNKKRPFKPGRRPDSRPEERRVRSEGDRYEEKKSFKPVRRADNKPEKGTGKKEGDSYEKRKPFRSGARPDKFFKKSPKQNSKGRADKSDQSGLIRLNKFIANAGISSRREADDLITSGVIAVNGKIITEMGFKVSPADKVTYGGQSIKRERMVYVLLNKPKDYITTLDDPEGRKTVLNLVRDACHERIYPVGRLDRNTTGLLLLTNDGDLTKKLTHPRYGIKKLYHVSLDKPLRKEEMEKIKEGVELEDGLVKADQITYIAGVNDKREVGIEIHSGKNRVIRRLFESLDYRVIKLDRTAFAGLTKKDLPRGRWRFLTDQEVGFLKMNS